MDTETSDAIDALRGGLGQAEARLASRIDAVETRLDSKIDGVEARLAFRIEDGETRLSSRIEDVEMRLTSRIEEVEVRLTSQIEDVEIRLGSLGSQIEAVDSKIDRVEATLRVEIHLTAKETRRHFDIVAESLRDDVRIIAEGLVSLSTKVDRLLPPARLP